MKRLLMLIVISIFGFTIKACEDGEQGGPTPPEPDNQFVLEITGETTVEKGMTIQLSTNYEGDKTISWESEDVSIATVNSNGLVKGESIGQTIISASVEGNIAYTTITVNKFSAKFTITGPSNFKVNSSGKYKLTSSSNVDMDSFEITWASANPNVATINEYGTLIGISSGMTEVIAYVDGEIVATKEVFIESVPDPRISLSGPTTMDVGERSRFSIGYGNLEYHSNLGGTIVTVNDSSLAFVYTSHPYEIVAHKEGTLVIHVTFKNRPDIFDELVIEIVDRSKTIEINGNQEMMQGEFNQLTATPINFDSTEFIWESSDESIALVEDGLVLGVNKGIVEITAKTGYEGIEATFVVEVKQNIPSGYTEQDLLKVEEILTNMTLSQKVGQMFAVGFNGTTYTSTLDSVIKSYNFGNVIYMGANVSNPSTIAKMSNDIQNACIASNGVPAFITIDQEGGRVVRLTNGGTHFLSNMAMGALSDSSLLYEEGKAIGVELRNYGINVDFAPVLDVNNNPANPVIGARSYGENPFLVAKCGVYLIEGLKDSKVMATAKHFPGHGNTSVDSHTGLPVITSSKEDLYKIELAPFVASIHSGIDAIMTTHIIFSAIDDKLPATLSEKVLTNLLRKELGYDGLIITDGMQMGALNSFGNASSLALQAVKAGVDILLYTSNDTPRNAHTALINAVKSGEISEDRINDSVKRILLKKLKYGLLDDYIAPNNDISELLQKHEELNNEFAMKSLTELKMTEEFAGLDKEKSVLIISPKCNYTLGVGDNSLGAYACKYLLEQGFTKCDYYTVSENATNTQINEVFGMLNSYDQVVVAMSNVHTKAYANSASLVMTVLQKKSDTLVIALDTPYDYLRYPSNMGKYVCVYGYQKASVIAISKYLNGEFKAEGVSPIEFK